MTPVFNIIIGLAMLVAGLSGKLALFGTGSPKALAAVGAAVLIMGVVQAWKRRARKNP